ncbi:TetR/AcrR family transcriptional regulator [Pseudalkalibacillus caeni]|uniref:TetR/AcrR family transcriptional regulator n=1 Tax=Exobacillus caeni TaxID=2574798 RepID=A0A5R9F117_9BACL|nr:TetR/AcrR family transcriptional regulator [Pseudalkalibacillus caeni]TLS36691.1 TetR/AcrR family transcriptional regulator [Pseudalkalibacillus caeni]
MVKKNVPSMVKDEKLIQKRRNQMIKAAVSLFKEKGFHRTTTREIARVAGFSIGTLYEYIRKKEDVLYLVCDSIYDEVRERLENAIDVDKSGLEKLKQAVHAFFKVMDDMQDEVLVMYQETKSLQQEALPYVLKKEIGMAETFEKLLKHCVDEKQLELSDKEIQCVAHNILVQGQMWTFRRWALHSLYTLEEYADIQLGLMLNGIEKGKVSSSV